MSKLDQERGKTTTEKIHRYCFSVISERCIVSLHAFMLFFIDMLWPHGLPVAPWFSSGTGISRESNIHRNSLSPRLSHETKAHPYPGKTKAMFTILILVNTLSPFTHSSILSFWITLIINPHHGVMNTSAQVFSGFQHSSLCALWQWHPGLSFALPAGQREQIFWEWFLD